MILQEEELEFRRSGEPTETKNKKLIVSYFGFVIENSNDLNTGFPNARNIGIQGFPISDHGHVRQIFPIFKQHPCFDPLQRVVVCLSIC